LAVGESAIPASRVMAARILQTLRECLACETARSVWSAAASAPLSRGECECECECEGESAWRIRAVVYMGRPIFFGEPRRKPPPGFCLRSNQAFKNLSKNGGKHGGYDSVAHCSCSAV